MDEPSDVGSVNHCGCECGCAQRVTKGFGCQGLCNKCAGMPDDDMEELTSLLRRAISYLPMSVFSFEDQRRLHNLATALKRSKE